MFSKKILRFFWIFFVFSFPFSFGLHESLAAEKKLITWGTVDSTSGTFPYYVVTAGLFNQKIPEINVTIRSTGGAVHNTRLMEKHELDMGASDTRLAGEAMQAKGPFKGKPFPDLRLLYVSMTNPLQFVVSERSGVKDIYGLEGKLITPGILGGTTEQVIMEIFKILGVRPKFRHSGYADALEAMKNEMIVGFGKYGTPDSSILDIASAMKIRILSLSDDDMEKILRNTAGLRKTAVPAGMYPGVGEFKTVENEWSEYIRKDFPAELAYKMVKTVWENRADIKKACPMFVGDRFTEVSLGVKIGYMHPGAIKYFRELGLTVPKALVPPEMREK